MDMDLASAILIRCKTKNWNVALSLASYAETVCAK